MDPNSMEMALLEALHSAAASQSRTKCDVILRRALQRVGAYSEASEEALCNSGDEEPTAWQFYGALRQLIRDGYAEGAGDLRTPAGPRYTECRITSKGQERLAPKP